MKMTQNDLWNLVDALIDVIDEDDLNDRQKSALCTILAYLSRKIDRKLLFRRDDDKPLPPRIRSAEKGIDWDLAASIKSDYPDDILERRIAEITRRCSGMAPSYNLKSDMP
jgi:hypothetical protein